MTALQIYVLFVLPLLLIGVSGAFIAISKWGSRPARTDRPVAPPSPVHSIPQIQVPTHSAFR